MPRPAFAAGDGTLRGTQVRNNIWVFTLGGDRIETSYGANCTAVVEREGH